MELSDVWDEIYWYDTKLANDQQVDLSITSTGRGLWKTKVMWKFFSWLCFVGKLSCLPNSPVHNKIIIRCCKIQWAWQAARLCSLQATIMLNTSNSALCFTCSSQFCSTDFIFDHLLNLFLISSHQQFSFHFSGSIFFSLLVWLYLFCSAGVQCSKESSQSSQLCLNVSCFTCFVHINLSSCIVLYNYSSASILLNI